MLPAMRRSRHIAVLRKYFDLGGHVRRQSPAKIKAMGRQTYKKGDEIRFAIYPDEADELYDALEALGVRYGAAYEKGHQLVVPIYGRAVVAELLEAMGRS